MTNTCIKLFYSIVDAEQVYVTNSIRYNKIWLILINQINQDVEDEDPQGFLLREN